MREQQEKINREFEAIQLDNLRLEEITKMLKNESKKKKGCKEKKKKIYIYNPIS